MTPRRVSLAALFAVGLLGANLIVPPTHAMTSGSESAGPRSAFTDGPISVLILKSPVDGKPGQIRMYWDLTLDTSSASVCVEPGALVQYNAAIFNTETAEVAYQSDEYNVTSGSLDVELPAGKYAAVLDPFLCEADSFTVEGNVWLVEFTLVKCDASTGNQYATPTYLDGSADVTLPDGSVIPLAQDSQVPVGSKVTTRGNARVELRTCDGSAMRVGPRTSMTLTKAYFGPLGEKRFSAKLFFGRVWTVVSGVMGGNEKSWELETDNAWAGVRGTTFCVTAGRVGGKPRTLVQVLDGVVQFRVKATGRKVLVQSGQYAEAIGLRPRVTVKTMPPGAEPTAETCSG